MKNMRKILSLVLALMMVLSLSVTAFADDGSATVIIKANGVEIDRGNATAGQSVYAYLVNTYGNPDGWSTFTDLNGATAKALNSMTVNNTPYTNGAVDGSTTDVEVEAWGEVYEGYGLVSTVQTGGLITAYNFVYVGYSWVYSVSDANGSGVDVSDKYMNQYTMNTGDVVTVEYKLVVSEWTSEYPLVEEYPYC